jgi:hypothetical protein
VRRITANIANAGVFADFIRQKKKAAPVEAAKMLCVALATADVSRRESTCYWLPSERAILKPLLDTRSMRM